MEVRSYKDIKVWQEGLNLIKEIYSVTIQFPEQEMYGLALVVSKF